MPAARLGLILCALLALILAACASGTGSSAEERFAAHLDQCTAQYGFDRDATEGVGERELAPNEREWRACAYSGVETRLIPGSAVPDAYRRLIAEDQVLTDAVAAGTITRQERRARLEELFAAIAEAEAQMRDAEAARMRMGHQRSAAVSLSPNGAMSVRSPAPRSGGGSRAAARDPRGAARDAQPFTDAAKGRH